MEPNNISDKKESTPNLVGDSSGRIFGGVLLVTVGLFLAARRMGYDYIPHWLFTWPMLMIVIGTYIGARNSFRLGGWLIPILIGGFFLIEDVVYDINLRHFFFPAVIISVGLFMILRPRRSFRRGWESKTISQEDTLEATSVFGGTKRNIISKDFKGGTVSTFFGGTDLNFMQADIQGTAVIDISTIFGGTKLVIPAHWNLKSEVVCVLGGIDDKRSIGKDPVDATKTLILKGSVILGGIDIKSY